MRLLIVSIFAATLGVSCIGDLSHPVTYRSDLRAGRGPAAIDAMRPGPSTYRPDVTAREMLTRMLEHNLHTAPVTTSDGRASAQRPHLKLGSGLG